MDDTIAKLVVAGPVGAGKTTLIRSLADSEPVSTEMPLTDGALHDKTTTTVALDFATITLEDGTPVFLYGLPGQEHFAFMRQIVLEGALGVILLLDGSDAAVAAHCTHWLQALRDLDASLPIVIGVSQTDRCDTFDMHALRQAIRTSGALVPLMTIDVRDREQAAQLTRALVLAVV